MNVNKKLAAWGESVLTNIDNLGYKLDEIGVENQINRHNLIAFIMASQKQLEGELDSLSARYDTNKAKIDNLARSAEKWVLSGFDVATFPARYAADRIKQVVAS